MSIHVRTPFNPARPWTDDDFAQLRRLAAAALSSGDIADRIGRTKPAVESMCRRRRIRLVGGTADAQGAKEEAQRKFAALRARIAGKRQREPVAVLAPHLVRMRWLEGATTG